MTSPGADFSTGAPVTADLEVAWIHGAATAHHDSDPPLQVHRVDPHTFILRQSKAVSPEAPFLYLFLGNDRAILLDTGDTANAEVCPVADEVETLVRDWLAEHQSREAAANYELVVAHTHSHKDHIRGDPQFAGRPHTRVVGPELADVQECFGITQWPAQVVSFDLGGRVLEVTGIPGHHATSIAVFDPWSGLLVTGDTVYPGRLYVDDMPAFVDSLDRLVALTETREVTAVMGCHVEMSRRPGHDFAFGARHQPDEAPLPMTVEQLVHVRDRAHDLIDRPGEHRFDDVVIYHGSSTMPMVRLVVKGKLAALRRRIGRRHG